MDGGRLGDGGCCAGFLFIKSTSLSYKGVDPRNCLNKTLGVGDVFGNGVGSFRFNFFSIVRLPGLCLRRGISKLYSKNIATPTIDLQSYVYMYEVLSINKSNAHMSKNVCVCMHVSQCHSM